MRRVRVLLYSMMVWVLLLSFPFPSYSEGDIAAITIPSADVTLSFIQPGRIAEIYVQEGDMVKVSQALIQMDDGAEQAQLAQFRAQSEDTTQTEAAEASLDQKRVDLEMLEWAFARSSATELEVKHARLDVRLAELSLKSARFEHEQSQKKYAEAQMRVDRMRLVSPVAGRVEKIEKETGESVNALEDVVRIVRTDPLWIDAPVPLSEGRRLNLRQTAQVKFEDSGQAVKGKIIFISTAADAASSTMRVRIEIPNQAGRPAGEHVSVSFPAPAKGKK